MNIFQALAQQIEGKIPAAPKPRRITKPKPAYNHPWNQKTRAERAESEFKKEQREFDASKPEYSSRDVQVGIDRERQLIREALKDRPVVQAEERW